MISGISGSGSYIFMYRYTFSGGSSSARMAHAAGSMGTSAAGQTASVSQISTRTEGSLNGRVNPVSGVKGVVPGYREDTVPDLFIRRGVDPAEYAVRMRIQYAEPSAAGPPGQEEAVPGIGKASEAADDGKCQTCEQRKYQDGSNDMGVSFKTPTRIAPEAAGAMVRSHEQEHVTRERAKAEREDREVVSQSVTLHTDICPECGRVYISGGTTQTTTASRPEQVNNVDMEPVQRRPFSAVA